MSKTLFIKGTSREPYFNLASEEYLLRQRGERAVYVWINDPAVIVGVNQNAAEEVNLAFTEEMGIKVVRRQTGGGAVYHDHGCICYTVIDFFDGARDNYRYFTSGIISYLAALGVKAEFSGRNDVSVNGRKISGNAQTVYKDRIMHHGTLLFSTDLSVLASALRPHKLKVESKGIKSVRARVANISEFLPGMTAEDFFDGLFSFLSKKEKAYEFTAQDISAIEKLVREKYSRFSWNIGSSPNAMAKAEKKFAFGLVTVNFDLEEGRLCNVNFYGDFFSRKDISGLNRALNGVFYSRAEVEKALSGVEDYIVGATPGEISDIFFD